MVRYPGEPSREARGVARRSVDTPNNEMESLLLCSDNNDDDVSNWRPQRANVPVMDTSLGRRTTLPMNHSRPPRTNSRRPHIPQNVRAEEPFLDEDDEYAPLVWNKGSIPGTTTVDHLTKQRAFDNDNRIGKISGIQSSPPVHGHENTRDRTNNETVVSRHDSTFGSSYRNTNRGPSIVSRSNWSRRGQESIKYHDIGSFEYKNPVAWSPWSHGCCCIQCVRTGEVGIIETFGAFKEVASPGLFLNWWPCTCIAGRLSLRVQQMDITCETKTKDCVFLQVGLAIQYSVNVHQAVDAYYRLTNPRLQMEAHVHDVVRSALPKLTVDDAFASKEDLSLDILRSLHVQMRVYGYDILDVLVVNLSPHATVQAAMNEINAAKREKESMRYKADAENIKIVKAAEAQLETLYLHGIGVANQRNAISKGLQETMIASNDSGSNSMRDNKDAMDLLVFSQYYDCLMAVGGTHIILEHDPATVDDYRTQLASYFVPHDNTPPPPSSQSDKIIIPPLMAGGGGIPDLLW